MRALPRLPSLSVRAFSLCTALGASTQESLDRIADGETGLASPPSPLPFVTVCGAVPALAPLPPSLERFESPVARIAARLVDELGEAPAAVLHRCGAERVAVLIGTSVGGLAVTERALAFESLHGRLPSDYSLEQQHGLYAIAELIAALTGARGPRYAISTACSSGAKVFGAAQRLICAGVIDAAIVGGIDSLCDTTLRGFHALSVLSAAPCRPFSAERAGMNLGEGGALFVLSRDGDAVARLLGVGESLDAHHMSSPHPEGQGAVRAMREALALADLRPEDVQHVNAHGTGTIKNDAVEAAAIEAVFGARVSVTSTKAATGHTLGAAGAVEAAIAIDTLRSGRIPPTLNAAPLAAEVRFDLAVRATPAECRVVMSNSFGFGGSNGSVLLGAA